MSTVPEAPVRGPFVLEDGDRYRRWRDARLAGRPADLDDLVVEIGDPSGITGAEYRALMQCLRTANMAVYACRRPPADHPGAVRAIAARFGLGRLDVHLCAHEGGITPLRVAAEAFRRRYIPYTDRAINWHTDGYYNPPDKQIRAFLMHCASDAESGGENFFMDPEIAYIRLREKNPDFIAALSHPTAMSIPANELGGTEIRGEIPGPVFSVHPGDGALAMRYTARTRSIAWRDDPSTRDAVAALGDILAAPQSDDILAAPQSDDVLRRRLSPGQGVITNNVLHGRTAFKDGDDGGKRRLVYRARFHDRISATRLDASRRIA